MQIVSLIWRAALTLFSISDDLAMLSERLEKLEQRCDVLEYRSRAEPPPPVVRLC